MVALIKYADSDSTKDPEFDDEKLGKGKKSGNTKGPQHNPASQGATVSARLIVIQILWPIPIHRIMVSVAREAVGSISGVSRSRGPKLGVLERW